MTNPEITIAPPEKRRSHKLLLGVGALGLVCALGVGAIGVTHAARTAKAEIPASVSVSDMKVELASEQGLNWNADPTSGEGDTRDLTARNTAAVPFHFSFVVLDSTLDDANPIMKDTIVTLSEQNGPVLWTGTLREFRDTALSPDVVLAAGEARNYEVNFKTPFDIDGDEWSAYADSLPQGPDRTLGGQFKVGIVAADVMETEDGFTSDLRAAQTQAGSIFTMPAALVRDALGIAALDGRTDAPAMEHGDAVDHIDAPEGDGTLRTFYDALSRELGSVELDADGLVVNSDADGDGIHYDADGIRQFG